MRWSLHVHRHEVRSSSYTASAQHPHVWEVGDCIINVAVRQTKELHKADMLPRNALIPHFGKVRGEILELNGMLQGTGRRFE